MKSYLLKYLGLGIVLCVAISAGADVCMSGTLASLSSQPCSIGAATFNFFSPDNLNPSNVAVSIITGASVGFTFTIPEQVGAASAIQVVGFNVTTETGTNITTAEIAVSSGFQGAVENACLGPGNNFNGFEPDGTVACLLDTQKLRLVAGFGSPLSSNASVDPTSFATVSTGLIADGSLGTVELTETFTLASDATVPEPATILLVAAGAMGRLRRRIRHAC